MLTKKTQLLMKIEGTPGDWEAPGASNGILAYDVVGTPEFAMFKRDPQSRLLSRYQSLSGVQTATITFKAELRGHGSSENPPDNIEVALEACGFLDTAGRLSPISTQPSSVSIQVEEDGVHKKFKGCVGNVRIVGNVGEPVFFEFTFRGTIEDITAGSLTTITGLPATVPPVLLSATFNTYVTATLAPLITTFEIDMQNEIAFSQSVSQATGIYRAYITGRNPIGSMDPEYNTSYDWLDRIITNDLGQLSLTIGDTTNNQCRITCPQIRFIAMDPADREGIRILTVPFEINRDATNNEIVIEFGLAVMEGGTKFDNVTIVEGITVGAPS